MTDPKETPKPVVQTREPKKKTAGIFDNLRTLPQPHPVEEMLGLTDNTPSTPSTPPRPSREPNSVIPSTLSREENPIVAPERDFTRVANSIVRSAVPSGIFGEQGGKSKELYDALYVLTRGAIKPVRKVRIPKEQLMRKAGIGSEVTLRKNLQRLCTAGLIKELIVTGAHGGNEYEVFLPEEIDLTSSNPLYRVYPLYTLSNREGLEALDPRGSRGGLSLSETTVYAEPKTLFKTNTENDDDEAGAALARELKNLIQELTGREATTAEFLKMLEVIEVIALEAKIAAARTTVSSAGPFLAEHLRRRLFKKNKQELAVESAESEPAPTSVDVQKCPDCAGVGWYYPEGKEKGMAKCKHARLLEQDNNAGTDIELPG